MFGSMVPKGVLEPLFFSTVFILRFTSFSRGMRFCEENEAFSFLHILHYLNRIRFIELP
jgi:hypothetical protein